MLRAIAASVLGLSLLVSACIGAMQIGRCRRSNSNGSSLQPEPPSLEQQQRAYELVRFYLEVYANYRSAKEAIAYAATVVYLTGAVAFVTQNAFWRHYPPIAFLGLALLLFSTASASISFVMWQFQQRLWAAGAVEACMRVAARWILTPPTVEELHPEPLPWRALVGQPPTVPAALAREIEQTSLTWWTPRDIALLLLLLWTVAAFVRLGAEWGPTM